MGVMILLFNFDYLLGDQVSLGPAEAAIAQSQHFDQLEALWNKVSPPRRRSNKVGTFNIDCAWKNSKIDNWLFFFTNTSRKMSAVERKSSLRAEVLKF